MPKLLLYTHCKWDKQQEKKVKVVSFEIQTIKCILIIAAPAPPPKSTNAFAAFADSDSD